MRRVLASPLGDVELSGPEARHWWLGILGAVALHLAGVAVWLAIPSAPSEPAESETVTVVALGPPGGRIETFEPAPPEPAPAEPQAAANRLTERAEGAPPIVRTPPPAPPPPGAMLSSGIGSGGEGVPLPEPAPPPPPPPPPPEPEPALDPAVMRAYARDASQLILERLVYPEDARRQEVEGRAQIRLVIARDGTLVSHEILRGTGHAGLDQAVSRAVTEVARFPRLPRGYREPRLNFVVSVRFTLQD